MFEPKPFQETVWTVPLSVETQPSHAPKTETHVQLLIFPNQIRTALNDEELLKLCVGEWLADQIWGDDLHSYQPQNQGKTLFKTQDTFQHPKGLFQKGAWHILHREHTQPDATRLTIVKTRNESARHHIRLANGQTRHGDTETPALAKPHDSNTVDKHTHLAEEILKGHQPFASSHHHRTQKHDDTKIAFSLILGAFGAFTPDAFQKHSHAQIAKIAVAAAAYVAARIKTKITGKLGLERVISILSSFADQIENHNGIIAPDVWNPQKQSYNTAINHLLQTSSEHIDDGLKTVAAKVCQHTIQNAPNIGWGIMIGADPDPNMTAHERMKLERFLNVDKTLPTLLKTHLEPERLKRSVRDDVAHAVTQELFYGKAASYK